MNVDKHGLITQKDGDGGDSAQRMGMYWAGVKLTNIDPIRTCLILGPLDTYDTLSAFGTKPLVRHPFQEGFRSDPNHFSRDQQDPLIVMMGLWNMKVYVKKIMWAQLKRFGRYQNRDWAGPSTAGIYIRALNIKWLWPLLLLCDLQLLVAGLAIWYRSRKDPENVDDNNAIIRYAQAQSTMPTPISYLGRKIYKSLRPWNYGCSEPSVQDASGFVYDFDDHVYHPVYGALRHYHRTESGGNEEIAEVWLPIVEKF